MAKFKTGDRVVCVKAVQSRYPGGAGWRKGLVFKVDRISNPRHPIYWGGIRGGGVYEDWLELAMPPQVEKLYKQLKKEVEGEIKTL